MFKFLKKRQEQKLAEQQLAEQKEKEAEKLAEQFEKEAEKLEKQKEFVLRYTAEQTVQWTEEGGKIKENDKSVICMLFFENDLNERKYELKTDMRAEYLFKSTKWHSKCEIWAAGGIIPEWAICVVAEKLSR